MVTIDKNQAIVAIIVLIATAYFTIFYDIFQELLKPFLKDYPIYTLYATAGFLAMGFGVFVLVYLTRRPEKSHEKKRSWWDWFWNGGER